MAGTKEGVGVSYGRQFTFYKDAPLDISVVNQPIEVPYVRNYEYTGIMTQETVPFEKRQGGIGKLPELPPEMPGMPEVITSGHISNPVEPEPPVVPPPVELEPPVEP